MSRRISRLVSTPTPRRRSETGSPTKFPAPVTHSRPRPPPRAARSSSPTRGTCWARTRTPSSCAGSRNSATTAGRDSSRRSRSATRSWNTKSPYPTPRWHRRSGISSTGSVRVSRRARRRPSRRLSPWTRMTSRRFCARSSPLSRRAAPRSGERRFISSTRRTRGSSTATRWSRPCITSTWCSGRRMWTP